MDNSAGDIMKELFLDVDPQTEAFYLDKLTPCNLRELLHHLNIVAPKDIDPEKLKEVIFISSIFMEKFEAYKLSDVVVLFKDSQVVNLVTVDKKVALYELDCQYPCSVCHFNVDDEGDKGQGLECSICESWFHNNCTDDPLTEDFYNSLTDSPDFIKICCPPCLKNGQVKKLHEKLTKIQCDFKDELTDVKQILSSYQNSIHVNTDDKICNVSFPDNIVENLKDIIKNAVKSEFDDLKITMQANVALINDKVESHYNHLSSVKSEVSSVNKEIMNMNSTLHNYFASNPTNDVMVTKFQQKFETVILNVEEVIGCLQDASSEASALMKCQGEDVNGKATAFEAAIERAVGSAERLDRFDFDSISKTVLESSEMIQQKLNDNVILPATVDSLTSKLVADLPSKLTPEIIATLANCTKQCDHPSQPPTSQSNLWITSGPPKTNPGSVTMSPKGRPNVNTPSTATKTKSTKTAVSHAGNNEMDVKKTISIGNVLNSSLSTSSKIKSEFNSCFPMMEIIHCKRAINGFILIEVDSVENAKKVVNEWDGKRFFNKDQDKETYAQILENARAKAIIEHVDESFNDAFITQEVQKVFGPKTMARRFRNKSGPTHVVLLTFDSKEDLDKATNVRIPIGNVIFRARPYELRPRLIQCYNCNKFNHIARNCTAMSRTCSFCSESHHENECNIKSQQLESQYKCSNCSGNHSAMSKECAIYKNWSNKLRLQHD